MNPRAMNYKYITLMELFSTEDIHKGFMVPNGYQLNINTQSGESKTLNAGEYSGSAHSYQEVAEGQVDGWTLTPITPAPSASSPFYKDEFQLSEDEEQTINSVFRMLAKPDVALSPLDFVTKVMRDRSILDYGEYFKPAVVTELNTSSMRSLAGKLEDTGLLPTTVIDEIDDVTRRYTKLQVRQPEPEVKNPDPQKKRQKVAPPTELRLLANPNYQFNPKEKRAIASKMDDLLGPYIPRTTENLLSLYTDMKTPQDLNRLMAPDAARKVLEQVRSYQEPRPFNNLVAMAIGELYPDEHYMTDGDDHYASIEYSTDQVSTKEIAEQLAILPAAIRNHVKDNLPSGSLTKGDVARFLGENLVNDFGIFVPEQAYIPNPPKITDIFDVRQIPKYKIKGKSMLESRIQHIIDVVTPEALNLPSDGGVDFSSQSRITARLGGYSGHDDTAELGISCTRYIYDTISAYINEVSGSPQPISNMIYDWSSGKWGATSSTGYAMRFLECIQQGRQLRDEFGYDEYIANNKDFHTEITDKVKKMEDAYLELRDVSQVIFKAAFPNGLTMHRGFSAVDSRTIEEYLAETSIQLASLSCFSSSRKVSQEFATPDSDAVGLPKTFMIETKVTSDKVSFIPSIAVPDGYRYNLPNGQTIKPDKNKEEGTYNEFFSEKEVVVISPEVYPYVTTEIEGNSEAKITITL